MEIKIIDYNKVHGIIITERQFSQYITDLYNKEISIRRNNKLKQLGI